MTVPKAPASPLESEDGLVISVDAAGRIFIDETEVITGETEITDALRENVTRIEEGDEEEVREVQENTTVVYDAGRFD